MESFEKDFFAANRRRLLEILPDRSALLLTAASPKIRSWDSFYPFCQDKNFYYLTGYNNPSAAILFRKTGNNLTCTMFVILLTPLQIHWNGYLPGPEEVKEITGIDSVTSLENLNKQIGFTLSNVDYLYLDFQPVPPHSPLSETLQAVEEIRKTNPQVEIRRAHSLLAGLREIKHPLEIERIRKAIDVTHAGIDGLLNQLKPGSTEYELEACFNFELHKRRCFPAFQTIIASGANATVLHYSSLDRTLEKNELVLTDLGAEYQHYSADISRTFPVNRRFSKKQLAFYELVLEANERTISAVKPGISLLELNDITRTVLATGLKTLGLISDDKDINKFYTHGVAHSLGLDTHDIVSGNNKTLVPGMVLTIEPGLYIHENNLGIRIEDNILVTEEGHINLSAAIPKKPMEIEKWISDVQSR
ncbi:aminopeptidase P N-terminal domain-containing protein [bacterium]|nr:aminopeptidase P N-terminal domain-containing protein [candidate division CSSED10-310 bacterium]